MVAANLRPAVVAVGPVADAIQRSMQWSAATTGLLTTLPLVIFGVVAPIAPRIAARFGIERAIFGALAVLVGAILLRLIDDPIPLFVGSALVGASIGLCNVALPALIKRDFPDRSGLMTGLYSMTISGGAVAAARLTVPIVDAAGGDWRTGLATWAGLVIVSMVVWLPRLPQRHQTDAVGHAGSVWTSPTAWAITVFMGAQSLIFYTLVAWLPQCLTDNRGMSHAEAGAVLAVGQVAALIASLVAPIVAGRFTDQRGVTAAVMAISIIDFAALMMTDRWPLVWVVAIMTGPVHP